MSLHYWIRNGSIIHNVMTISLKQNEGMFMNKTAACRKGIGYHSNCLTLNVFFLAKTRRSANSSWQKHVYIIISCLRWLFILQFKELIVESTATLMIYILLKYISRTGTQAHDACIVLPSGGNVCEQREPSSTSIWKSCYLRSRKKLICM